MTAKQIAQLENIKNRHTLYEAVIVLPDGKTMLMCYCGKSYSRLYRAAQNRYDSIKEKTGFSEFAVYVPNKKVLPDEKLPLIKFTGRTQRQAILEGELPY